MGFEPEDRFANVDYFPEHAPILVMRAIHLTQPYYREATTAQSWFWMQK